MPDRGFAQTSSSHTEVRLCVGNQSSKALYCRDSNLQVLRRIASDERISDSNGEIDPPVLGFTIKSSTDCASTPQYTRQAAKAAQPIPQSSGIVHRNYSCMSTYHKSALHGITRAQRCDDSSKKNSPPEMALVCFRIYQQHAAAVLAS